MVLRGLWWQKSSAARGKELRMKQGRNYITVREQIAGKGEVFSYIVVGKRVWPLDTDHCLNLLIQTTSCWLLVG